MQVLVFDLRAELGHFRRPDTAKAHASYPFVTRTALRGLLGAVLGMERWPEYGATAGIRLLRPVRTRVQQLSLLGGFVSGKDQFNRPTTVELVIRPHYRIYYAGPLAEELGAAIAGGRAVYPTYLGSAFALVFPRLVEWAEGEEVAPGLVTVGTVIPVPAVRALRPMPGRQVARAGGLLYTALDGRRFRGSVDVLYEVEGRPLQLEVDTRNADPPVRLIRLAGSEEVVVLW
ncbi:MAG: CRISPR-associated protein Cas5 [Firmicutes bacterium]|nr:CRISPR-associated protein Cas5 [Bacillota bacterium]